MFKNPASGIMTTSLQGIIEGEGPMKSNFDKESEKHEQGKKKAKKEKRKKKNCDTFKLSKLLQKLKQRCNFQNIKGNLT